MKTEYWLEVLKILLDIYNPLDYDYFMKKSEKKEWIVKYITIHGWQDIFMEDFVNEYIKQCNPKDIKPVMIGVPKVPELGRYLGELYKDGKLDRFAVGLKYHYDGYPKWCYGYEIIKGE